jgi:hypothetical protein
MKSFNILSSRLRQEDLRFKASLGYITRSCYKNSIFKNWALKAKIISMHYGISNL